MIDSQPLGPYDAPAGVGPVEDDLTNPYPVQVPPDDVSNPYLAAGTGIFEQYPPAHYKAGGLLVRFPVIEIQQDGTPRIVPHPRMYRKKNRLEWTGDNGRTFVIVAEFYNNAADKKAPGTYPDDLNAILELLELDEVGELLVPTVGPVRVRPGPYKRIERNSERDFATLQMTFYEDAPDDESATRWQAPSATSVASTFAEDAFGGLNASGLEGDPFGEFSDFCDQLAELAAAPQEYVQAWDAKFAQAANDLGRVVDAYSGAANVAPPGIVAMFASPVDTGPMRAMARLTDLIGGARAATQPRRVITRTFLAQVTIFDVANYLRQSVSALIQLNSALDLLAIMPNTPVRCYGP